MQKHLFEILVGILVTIGVALVLATGYLSYQTLTSIVDSIHEDSHPDEKLSLISDIATSMDKAENSIRLYAFTKNNADLKPYQNLIENIDNQLDALRRSASGNDRFLANVDTISNLIEEKFTVWNDMLALSNTNVASQFLDTISEQIESKIESDSLRKNRSIFKKIFKRQKKQEINEEKIVKNIEQYREEEKQYAQKIRQKEFQLSATSSKLTARFYSLINKLKTDERNERLAKAKNADALANETFRWIGWFSLSATISALIVLFVISTYVRKTRASRKALEASKAEAENLAKTKELFVANVSHEIRTPLNVISGFVDQMLKKPVEDSLAASLKIVKSSSDHLVRIINEVLDFSKLQSGKMKLDPVHFKIFDLLEEIRLLFENQAAEKKTNFKVIPKDNLPPVLFGDPIRLKQIIINLVSNAIKFTKEGTVTLKMDAEDTVNGLKLNMIVSDTGIGIGEENLEKIFDDFTQAESDTSRKYGGTGLGLSIVKKLIDLHGGSIKVESKVNEGTRFICSLPYSIGKDNLVEEIATGEITVPERIRNIKVLIVDDEVYNRKLMRTILSKWNVKHEEAEDGNQAIEKVQQHKFDFILLDIQMPGLSGLEVTGYIREKLKLKTSDLAIVLTTATNVSKEDFEKYKSMGIDAYLPKPFTEEQLLKTLTELSPTVATPQKTTIMGDPSASAIDDENFVDLKELYRLAGDDHLFVKEMLEKFIESFENGMSRIQSALAENNLEAISNTAHKMASPCRHIGAQKLLADVKNTEHLAANEAGIEQIRESVKEAEIDYKTVKEIILEHIEKVES